MTLHDSEQVIGRYRKDLGMDQRYRMARLVLDPWPEPRQRREEPHEPFWQQLGTALFLVLAGYLLVAAIAASNVPAPDAAAPPVQETLVR